MQTPELRPCPFCGGEKVVFMVGSDDPYIDGITSNHPRFAGIPEEEDIFFGVRCNGCGAMFDLNYEDIEEAAAAWNKRAGDGGNDGNE